MKRGVGQPRAVIPWDQVDEMARAHCSITGIAGVLGISRATLTDAIEREYNITVSEYRNERREHGTALMRGAIYNAGLKGNIIAQIFWLKNRDGWTDRAVMQHEMLPPVQLQLPADMEHDKQKMIEQFFNPEMKSDGAESD
jgi:hypothetical protein